MCAVRVNPEGYISLSLFHHDLYLTLQFALNTWRRSVPGLWLKPIRSQKLARSHSSISLVNRGDYPPLIRRSSFLARAFRFETAITAERASERAYQIHHLREHAWPALAISSRKTTRKKRRGEEKRKSGRHHKKNNDRAPEAPFKIIIMRLPRGARRTFSRVLI